MSAAIPRAVLGELKRLNDLSAKVNGKTPLDDPKRAAGDEFCAMAVEVIDKYGVSAGRLSLALGASEATVRMKLSRRGYGVQYPSQRNYKGIVSPGRKGHRQDSCQRGHAFSGANVEMLGARRACRECRKASRQARREVRT